MVIQYKCPNCGADMAFDSATGMLHCESCGHDEAIENMDQNVHQKDRQMERETYQNWNNVHTHQTFSGENTKEYVCKNCGAVIFTDADTTATNCSFCGAAVVLGDRLQGTYAPAKVIPFKISKDEAKQAFRKWCGKGLFTPNDFKPADRIKSITGMYVPFFLYDMHGDAELNATCTKVRTYTRGDYIYTETQYFNVYRNADLTYLKVPADASEKMNDDMMDRLEPFHYNELKDFQMPYLAGYLAEKYNYDEKQLFPRVRSRVEDFADSYLRSTIHGYSTTRVNHEHVNVQPIDTFYTLIPVWMVYYDYDHAEHTFAMNGQTGKIVGTPPISKQKVFAYWGVFALIALIIQLVIEFIVTGGIF